MPEWLFIMSQYIPGKEGLMIMNDPHTGWCPAVRSDFYFSKANKDCWYSWHKPPQLRQQADSITYNATIAAWLVEEFPEKVGETFIGSTGLPVCGGFLKPGTHGYPNSSQNTVLKSILVLKSMALGIPLKKHPLIIFTVCPKINKNNVLNIWVKDMLCIQSLIFHCLDLILGCSL